MSLVKASIRAKRGDGELTCAFNPGEYTVTKSAEWRETPTSGAPSAPKPEFVGTRPRTMRMKLLFDAWATDTDDISGDVEKLLEWTNPTAASIAQGRPAPPILSFHWGASTYFDAYLSSVDAQYTMFESDGTPLRATVAVTLVEIPSEPARQNPSSGSLARHRTAMLAAGDSLHSIAHREYGDSTLWRGIAAANRIDDPLRVEIGTTLLIPPRDEAASVS
jgi:hypothetical protein